MKNKESLLFDPALENDNIRIKPFSISSTFRPSSISPASNRSRPILQPLYISFAEAQCLTIRYVILSTGSQRRLMDTDATQLRSCFNKLQANPAHTYALANQSDILLRYAPRELVEQDDGDDGLQFQTSYIHVSCTKRRF